MELQATLHQNQGSALENNATKYCAHLTDAFVISASLTSVAHPPSIHIHQQQRTPAKSILIPPSAARAINAIEARPSSWLSYCLSLWLLGLRLRTPVCLASHIAREDDSSTLIGPIPTTHATPLPRPS